MEAPIRTPRASRSAGRRATPERMRKILDAAIEIAVEDGFAAVTMQSVAHRTGYVRPIVYDCYGTPENIILAALDRETHTAVSILNAILEKIADASALSSWDFVKLTIEYGTTIDTPSRTWLLLFVPREGVSPQIQEKLNSVDDMFKLAFGFALSLVKGETDIDVECASPLALELLRSAARQMISSPSAYPKERIQRFVTSITHEIQSPS